MASKGSQQLSFHLFSSSWWLFRAFRGAPIFCVHFFLVPVMLRLTLDSRDTAHMVSRSTTVTFYWVADGDAIFSDLDTDVLIILWCCRLLFLRHSAKSVTLECFFMSKATRRCRRCRYKKYKLIFMWNVFSMNLLTQYTVLYFCQFRLTELE